MNSDDFHDEINADERVIDDDEEYLLYVPLLQLLCLPGQSPQCATCYHHHHNHHLQ